LRRGYSTQPDFLSEEQRAKIFEEADDAIERWQEDAEVNFIEPKTPLQHLLQQWADILTESLNIHQDAVERRGDLPTQLE
jgi:hypothetical protein